jgi:hypothetical protein
LSFYLAICGSSRAWRHVFVRQEYAAWQWHVHPALIQLAGITVFAIKIFVTFLLEPCHAQKQPLVVAINLVDHCVCSSFSPSVIPIARGKRC